jgi:hypothetical protein
MYREAEEVQSFEIEALVPTGRLWAPLGHLGITTAPEFWMKRAPRPGRVEYRAIVEIFLGSRVVSRHTGPAFRVSCTDVVVDTTWQAITTWSRNHHSKLKNSVYHILPQWKKDKFKVSRVKKDVPRMEMVNLQVVMVELSIHL